MTETHNRARQQAEIAFAQAQSQFLARESAVEELNAVAQARAEKTLRLKTARLAKEQADRERAATVTSSKPVAKARRRTSGTSKGTET